MTEEQKNSSFKLGIVFLIISAGILLMMLITSGQADQYGLTFAFVVLPEAAAGSVFLMLGLYNLLKGLNGSVSHNKIILIVLLGIAYGIILIIVFYTSYKAQENAYIDRNNVVTLLKE